MKLNVLPAVLLCYFLNCVQDLSAQNLFRKKDKTLYTYGDQLANSSNDGSVPESRISVFILGAFKELFPASSNVKWYRVEDKFLVEFSMEERKQKAFFNSKGKLLYHISFWKANELPFAVRKLIKREYVEWNILHPTRVKERGQEVWIADLTDGENLVTVRVEDDYIDEVSRYTLSKFSELRSTWYAKY